MSSKPKYERIKDTLRKRIIVQEAGSRIPSTNQLHREFEVSPRTIDRAISDLVSEGLVERQVRRGTFVSRPKTSGTGHFGFVYPSDIRRLKSTTYVSDIMHRLQVAAGDSGRHLLIAMDVHAARPAFVNERNLVAGVFIMFNHDSELVEAYLDRGFPVVLIDPLVRVDNVPFVTSDHYMATQKGLRHLAQLGHRRIALITVDIPHCMPSDEKNYAYRMVMRDLGFEDSSAIHAVPPGRWGSTDGTAITEFVKKNEITACFCVTDAVAVGVIDFCHKEGIRVPEDLSVVGFEDSSGGAGDLSHVWPDLTTIRVHGEELARQAVQMMETLMSDECRQGHGILVHTQLVERSSTQPYSSQEALSEATQTVGG